jgi:hypothetical protein
VYTQLLAVPGTTGSYAAGATPESAERAAHRGRHGRGDEELREMLTNRRRTITRRCSPRRWRPSAPTGMPTRRSCSRAHFSSIRTAAMRCSISP